MGRDRHTKNKIGPFVPLLLATLDSPAWRAMSHGARSLYAALKRRYGIHAHNNGRLFLSQRNAAEELGSHHNEVARWYRELQHYGFVVKTSAGSLGVDGKGKAPHWRLTELGYMHDMPTRDFLHWDGKKYRPTKTESRAPFPAHPVLEKAHTTVPESRPLKSPSVLEMAHIYEAEGVPEKAHVSSLPLPTANPAAFKASPELAAKIGRLGWATARAPSGSAVASGCPKPINHSLKAQNRRE